MKLSFSKSYLSISHFPEIDLPPFTLITGVNGVGKTHLLQAINNGMILNSLTQNPQAEINLFDWSTLIPNNTKSITTAMVFQERDKVINYIPQIKTQNTQNLEGIINRHKINKKWDKPVWDIIDLSKEELSEYLPEEKTYDTSAFEQISRLVDNLGQQIINQSTNNFRLKSTEPRELLKLTSDSLDELPIAWSSVNIFQQTFSQIFLSYFELQKLNKLKKLDFDNGDVNAKALEESEFIQTHGQPPWEFVNKVLFDAGLGFNISHPKGYTTTSFVPKLTKISSGVEIQFSTLSSGEKILMSFAFCLYHSQDDRQNIKKPKILLFDEVDATLHPSMSKQLLKTITESLVGTQNIHVIMTTHSPSTVAVAPEEAIYIMKSDKHGLHKVSKRQAISILTDEIPTLAINFNGRRQVFVESQTDAERFELLYGNLIPIINSERSLVFIGVGLKKDSDNEIGSGCAQVKAIVQSLSEGGNESVYGLLDWDTRNKPEGRIHVLGEGNRYAIENCLLDPLLVLSLLMRENWKNNTELGLDCNIKYHDISNLAKN
jgi:AAA15 family ATPase/GTPase